MPLRLQVEVRALLRPQTALDAEGRVRALPPKRDTVSTERVSPRTPLRLPLIASRSQDRATIASLG